MRTFAESSRAFSQLQRLGAVNWDAWNRAADWLTELFPFTAREVEPERDPALECVPLPDADRAVDLLLELDEVVLVQRDGEVDGDAEEVLEAVEQPLEVVPLQDEAVPRAQLLQEALAVPRRRVPTTPTSAGRERRLARKRRRGEVKRLRRAPGDE